MTPHTIHAFPPEAIAEDPILAYFDFAHLPEHRQGVSRMFYVLAGDLRLMIPRSPERTVMFRKLLEAKDCAVRAAP